MLIRLRYSFTQEHDNSSSKSKVNKFYEVKHYRLTAQKLQK